MNILITGGAGFIGLHLAARSLREGASVTLLDNLSPQIHGTAAPTIPSGAKFVQADVCDRAALESALAGIDVVVHLAAETGTGQSMYEVEKYERVNVGGTALLFDLLVNQRAQTVKKVIVASSRAIYGEGSFVCAEHGTVFPGMRSSSDMKAGQFEPLCTTCGKPVQMRSTAETSQIHPTSFYGISKQVQEQMTLLFTKALGIDGYALRYQNVYGPGQSLKNPYTGILAIFSNLARANKPIYIFEDGEESRDFVYIDDVVEATWRCIARKDRANVALNVGGGESVTVATVAKEVVAFFKSQSTVTTTGEFRVGDIRHNLGDGTLAKQTLGYVPTVKFADGVKRFLTWAQASEGGNAADYERSLREMRDKALMG